MEVWKLIKHGYYEVSTLGNIRNNKTKRIIKQHLGTTGYMNVNIYINKKRINFNVHRLVIETFLLNPSNLPIVDHRNRIKTDNNISNLRWVTHSENMENQSRRLISLKDIEKIISLHENGVNFF